MVIGERSVFHGFGLGTIGGVDDGVSSMWSGCTDPCYGRPSLYSVCPVACCI